MDRKGRVRYIFPHGTKLGTIRKGVEALLTAEG